MYQKDLNMSYLLDFYGDAIPEKHREIMMQYYDEDLSLSEIAEIFDISRQGARHLIKKGEEQLLFLEDKLGLAQRYKDSQKSYADFCSLMDGFKGELDKIECNEKLLSMYGDILALSRKLCLE